MTLERKARWVKDGHRIPEPIQSTFSGVVSSKSDHILLLYADLNDLHIHAYNTHNAFLQAPSSEQRYFICCSEFGLENPGKLAIIINALYSGKSSEANYGCHSFSTQETKIVRLYQFAVLKNPIQTLP